MTNKQKLELDKIDLHILTVLQDEPLWKQGAAERLQDIGHHSTAASIQTIGRRITCLADHGLLEPCIISPDELERNLITAYRTTEHGCTALDDYYICRGCEVVKTADTHVHKLQPAGEFFAAKT